jgi:hypothetical protein
MILNKYGHKRTANELAKELVLQHGESINHDNYWTINIADAYTEKVTGREEDMVQEAIDRQLARIAKLLGHPDPHRNKEDD